MTPRQKRFSFVLVGLAALGIATYLIFSALGDATAYFRSPTDIAQGKVPQGSKFRLGGLVEADSIQRQSDDLTVHFVVTDLANRVTVSYTGILPDLFTEGQGVVTEGKMAADGIFMAEMVLAKHDETYMPPEVAEALEKGGKMGEQHPGSTPPGDI